MARHVFVTGGTGYVGRPLIRELMDRGYEVRGVVRSASLGRLPSGCQPVVGDALDSATFASAVRPADTLVHLVGVAHPSPAKARQFLEIDLVSARASVTAAVEAGVRHFVFVSVAHPAPVMKAYQAAREAAESTIRDSGLPATILRPWYVLGPGHWWPLLLVPCYAVAERWPSTREPARRLGLVTLPDMVTALVAAVEHPPSQVRVLEVPDIKALRARWSSWHWPQ